MTLCKCGCGREANHGGWVKGHWNRGIKRSDEYKQKISKAQSGKKRSAETRQRMSIAQTGKHLSEAHKQAISESRLGEKHHMYGKSHSAETRQKLSQSHTIHGRYSILAKHIEHKKQECVFGCKNVKRYEQHHEPPIEDILTWGGKLINLCASCHRRVHRSSLKLPKSVGVLWTLNDTKELII